jgi:deoxyribodipyrimidine photolyase-related protein
VEGFVRQIFGWQEYIYWQCWRLAGVEPMQVNGWFLAAFVDAHEWVMPPNVLGMGLNADGGRTATKPYIALANYINRMSDYCAGCRYDPKARTGPDACPFNFLYWNFLLEHEQRLRANPRLGNAVLGLRHLDDDEWGRVREQAGAFLRVIGDQ